MVLFFIKKKSHNLLFLLHLYRFTHLHLFDHVVLTLPCKHLLPFRLLRLSIWCLDFYCMTFFLVTTLWYEVHGLLWKDWAKHTKPSALMFIVGEVRNNLASGNVKMPHVFTEYIQYTSLLLQRLVNVAHVWKQNSHSALTCCWRAEAG